MAHGIASTIDDKKVRIGSAHFIFEDENIPLTKEISKIQNQLINNGSSLLYLAYNGELAGILAISDPIRPDAKDVIKKLKESGIERCVMITGDTEGAAKKIAASSGLDDFYSQALPEDKVNLVKIEKEAGRKVLMIGDGINDAPALGAADAGLAIEESSSIASDVADIVLTEGGLENVLKTRLLG